MAAQTVAADPAADAGETADPGATDAVETEETADPSTETQDETESTDTEGETVEGEGEEGKEKPEGEEKPAEAAKAEIPEDQLRAAAIKFANRTMAAARRTQRDTERRLAESERTAAELPALKAKATQLDTFVASVRQDPRNAYLALGYTSFKAFADAIAGMGDEPPQRPVADDRVDQLIRERNEERLQAAKNEVFSTLAKDERFDLVTSTSIGRRELSTAIDEYHKRHGSVPDSAIEWMASNIERGLADELGKTKKFSGVRPAETNKGTPAPKQAANGARNGGKTLGNSRTAGAPVTREYSGDASEMRRQIQEEMRAAGEL